jgi:hypothetical protein
MANKLLRHPTHIEVTRLRRPARMRSYYRDKALNERPHEHAREPLVRVGLDPESARELLRIYSKK